MVVELIKQLEPLLCGASRLLGRLDLHLYPANTSKYQHSEKAKENSVPMRRA
jgi:hypothetical protein